MAYQNTLFISNLFIFITLVKSNKLANITSLNLHANNHLQNSSNILSSNSFTNTNINCPYDNYCHVHVGDNSKCLKEFCICDFGYHFLNKKCVQISCTSNPDCTKYLSNTKCNLAKQCVCEQNYYEFDNQICQKDANISGTQTPWKLIKILIGGFVFICIVAVIICIFCFCQRRQRQNRVGPSVNYNAGRQKQKFQPGFAQQQKLQRQYGYQERQAYPNPNFKQHAQNPAFTSR